VVDRCRQRPEFCRRESGGEERDAGDPGDDDLLADGEGELDRAAALGQLGDGDADQRAEDDPVHRYDSHADEQRGVGPGDAEVSGEPHDDVAAQPDEHDQPDEGQGVVERTGDRFARSEDDLDSRHKRDETDEQPEPRIGLA
jgi:hypothetical protein